MLKVGVLTTSHPSRDTRVFELQARELTKRGLDVAIFSGRETGPSETVEGVKIVRLSGASTRGKRFLLNPWKVFWAAWRSDRSIFHFHDPEFLPWAGLLRMVTRKPVVYDRHEFYPDVISVRDWVPLCLRRPMSRLTRVAESALMRLVSGVVAVNDIALEEIRLVNPKVVRFMGLPSLESASVLGSHRQAAQITYVGGISRTRGASIIPQVMKLLRASHPATTLVLAGPVHDRQAQDLVGLAHDGLIYRGVLPFAQVEALLRESAIGWAPLDSTPNHVKTWALKIGEYMAAGLPIVMSNIGYSAGVVKEVGCGIVVDDNSSGAHAEALKYLLNHPAEAGRMGKLGRDYVLSGFSVEHEADRLEAFYRALTRTT